MPRRGTGAATLAASLAALLPAACGGTGSTGATIRSSTRTARHSSTATAVRSVVPSRPPAAFAWLRPKPPPADWPLADLSDGVVLAYPPTWRRLKADPGAASAAVVGPRDLIAEYLNVTPRQGAETLANWASFRREHNAEEGDTHVQVLAAARGLRFRAATGSCVIDRYQTTRTRYQEIACLVHGKRADSVIVAAVLANRWAQSAPILERAVSAFQG